MAYPKFCSGAERRRFQEIAASLSSKVLSTLLLKPYPSSYDTMSCTFLSIHPVTKVLSTLQIKRYKFHNDFKRYIISEKAQEELRLSF